MILKTPPRVIDLLLEYDRFLISSHLRSDGDAVGSQLALAGILHQLGKETVIQNETTVQKNYAFLPGADRIEPFGELPFQPQAAILLDAPAPRRIGTIERHLSSIDKIINIDHHVSNSGYGDACWVEPGSSSVGEMIFHLIPLLGAELTRDIALCIYVAILTDMGKFQYMVTSQSGARILSLAARLVETGLVPYEIYKKVYNIYSTAPLKLLGEALSTLEFRKSDQIAYMKVSREMLARAGGGFDITENLISYPRDIATTRIAILFTEHDEFIKVSFRSKEPDIIDVNEIASRFGGGGHPAAAGAEVYESLDEAADRVIAVVEEYLSEIKN
jgi:bifunctional oligoribonuclease and PAP phosphatase NrnA